MRTKTILLTLLLGLMIGTSPAQALFVGDTWYYQNDTTQQRVELSVMDDCTMDWRIPPDWQRTKTQSAPESYALIEFETAGFIPLPPDPELLCHEHFAQDGALPDYGDDWLRTLYVRALFAAELNGNLLLYPIVLSMDLFGINLLGMSAAILLYAAPILAGLWGGSKLIRHWRKTRTQ